MTTLSPSRRAFTLIELLTVIAIIGVLAAILIPTVNAVRASARSSQSATNLRQLGLAVRLYAQENRDALVPGQYNWNNNWVGLLWKYGDKGPRTYIPSSDNQSIFYSPGWDADPLYNASNNWSLGYAMNGVPGLPAQWQLNWSTGNPNDTWVGSYKYSQIENPNRRLLFVESNEWHLDSGNIRSGVSLGRNGSGVNIVFFDGHVAKSNDLDAIARMINTP
jgi:prepilin-type N-terminal cleavage/methylation domain-containing protein/prepilin-type processing-associated H-X9-DG protein